MFGLGDGEAGDVDGAGLDEFDGQAGVVFAVVEEDVVGTVLGEGGPILGALRFGFDSAFGEADDGGGPMGGFFGETKLVVL